MTGRDPVPGGPWLVVGTPRARTPGWSRTWPRPPGSSRCGPRSPRTRTAPRWPGWSPRPEPRPRPRPCTVSSPCPARPTRTVGRPRPPGSRRCCRGWATPGSPHRCGVLTRGAVSVAADDPVGDDLGAAAVWGLGRVAAMEYPDRWGGLVDLGPATDARTVRGLAAALTAGTARTSSRSARTACTGGGCCPHPRRVPPRRGSRGGPCWSPAGPAHWVGTWPATWPGPVPAGWCC
ncbi:hypothetical protein [Pseudonocardia sp. ICBG601]|uniref:SpnB-like Rossmann fold domain-containing protein n=1 Tax=Pseudonocardia sp. ICBG601 TaxID=2846759 RepID=UPI0035AB99BB